MTDENQTGVTKTIGQVVHEALAKFETEATAEWASLSDDAKSEAERFAAVIEAVVLHVLGKQAPAQPSEPTTAAG